MSDSLVRFLHCADLHLGCRRDSLPQNISNELAGEAFEILNKMLRFVREGGADALLIAGDFFDTALPSPSVFEKAVDLIGDADVPVFIAPGNHDYLDARSPYLTREWPECVHIFSSESPEHVLFHGVNIYGCGFSDNVCLDSMLADFHADPSRHSVMVLHGDLAHVSRYCPIRREDIATSGLDYLALGHIHAASSPKSAGDTVYAYSGCALGCGFGDCGNPGAYLVTVSDELSIEFISFDARRFVSLTVNAGQISDLPAMLSGHSADLISLTVTGTTAEKFDPEFLYRVAEPLVYYLKINDDTVCAKSISESALSLLVRRIADEKGTDELALRLALSAINGEVSPQW